MDLPKKTEGIEGFARLRTYIKNEAYFSWRAKSREK